MEWILIGTVTKTHGLKGEMKFRAVVSDDSLFEGLKRVRLNGPKGGEKDVHIAAFRGAGAHIVRFDEVNSIEEAQLLAGWTVSIPREDFKKLPEGEFYWFEIEGLEVFDEDGRFYGRVEEIIETGSNDVYVVRDEDREILLPMIDSVVKTIDLRQRKLVFHPVEGLLEDIAD